MNYELRPNKNESAKPLSKLLLNMLLKVKQEGEETLSEDMIERLIIDLKMLVRKLNQIKQDFENFKKRTNQELIYQPHDLSLRERIQNQEDKYIDEYARLYDDCREFISLIPTLDHRSKNILSPFIDHIPKKLDED
jgi:hypothetical protein